jgi:DNA-directed RNA polymerase subunit RPC12/RpoP
MALIYVCDRCGAKSEEDARMGILPQDWDKHDEYLLCDNCDKYFYAFMKNVPVPGMSKPTP